MHLRMCKFRVYSRILWRFRVAQDNEDMMIKTKEVLTTLMDCLSKTKPDKRAAFLASETLLAYIAVDMGMGFQDLMNSLATNVPQFYRKWHETKTKDESPQKPPGVVLDMEAFRKGKDDE